MKKNMGIIFSIILVICFIIDTIGLYSTGNNSGILYFLTLLSNNVGSISVAFVVFFMLFNRDNSKFSLIGLIIITVYLFLGLINTIFLTSTSIKAYIGVSKIMSIVIYLIQALEYIGILEILMPKKDNKISVSLKYAAMGIMVIYAIISCIAVLGNATVAQNLAPVKNNLLITFRLIALFSLIYYVIFDKSKNQKEVKDNPQKTVENTNEAVSQNTPSSTPQPTNQVVSPQPQAAPQPVIPTPSTPVVNTAPIVNNQVTPTQTVVNNQINQQ